MKPQTNITLSDAGDWHTFKAGEGDPMLDLAAAFRATSAATMRTFGFRGPIPVDLTLASAALNRGEAPFRKAAR